MNQATDSRSQSVLSALLCALSPTSEVGALKSAVPTAMKVESVHVAKLGSREL
eukprot:CAMPEP_0115835826 /NCGR_PEP_ID=MMETSP0287-20121206/4393_1 /TAXON_ID=412157 /ORGANISM="Chrysochromulina rotalis, Strain UIO044" /LENGTH=52 /DNA_ID=CAMNT_0003289293 /DNA_START=460 /DNA_END=618 /DNA_ORIENTATION=+